MIGQSAQIARQVSIENVGQKIGRGEMISLRGRSRWWRTEGSAARQISPQPRGRGSERSRLSPRDFERLAITPSPSGTKRLTTSCAVMMVRISMITDAAEA